MFLQLQCKNIIALQKGHRIPFGEEFNQEPVGPTFPHSQESSYVFI